ncbi:Phage minor structural protein GP20 [Acetitomaculum ruminis DSM 5522]|uniref:Phage minor structural protein GP20 n=1 Tax=Acetitomaculum ruminis DSM 5522 TaxID=1120918 RepID=A0A1I0WGK9_9FIRM|nr:phage scaffolding protein [Acetitomaculum ruminis]SFA87704.1 Phage minor structural protein GP20 [Acetitomaculum ruminis DSM 5522]
MKKEDLLKLEGMSEQLAEKVAELSKEELKEYIPKTRFNEVNEAKKNAEKLLKEHDEKLEALKEDNADNEELKKQIETLQEENTKMAKAHEDELKALKVSAAVESALTKNGAKNTIAVKALLDLKDAELLEDGSIKGLADQIKKLKEEEDTSFLFNVSDGQTKLKGSSPANKGSKITGEITKEQFRRMGYKERTELFNTNKELYDSLTERNE